MPNKKVPKPAGALKKNRFYFDLEIDGEAKEFSLPKLEFINRKAARRLREANADGVNPQDAVGFVVDVITLIDKDLGAIVDGLEDDQIDWISGEWAKASGVTVPESSASSTS
jgi:hypothetical protein